MGAPEKCIAGSIRQQGAMDGWRKFQRSTTSDPVDYTPEQFKARREDLGFSVTELAQFLGVTRRSVNYWEADNGRRPTSMACRVLWWIGLQNG